MNDTGDRIWKDWWRGGDLFVWINATAVAVCIVAVVGVVLLLLVRGSAHFWPAPVLAAEYAVPGEIVEPVIGQVRMRETVTREQLTNAGFKLAGSAPQLERFLLQVGNRDESGADFRWFLLPWLQDLRYPSTLMLVERREWGNLYGDLLGMTTAQGHLSLQANPRQGTHVSANQLWQAFQQSIQRAGSINTRIEALQLDDIGDVNFRLEQLRRQQLALAEADLTDSERLGMERELAIQRSQLNRVYEALQLKLEQLYRDVGRDQYEVLLANGERVMLPVEKVVRAYQPNALGLWGKLQIFGERLWEFLSTRPREANTEGGVFPAIFGTVLMVLLMTVLVTPMGILAAVYLREYARQGLLTRTIRIAVNNLAGVPSIVYGLFGLGFFVYTLGGSIDSVFYSEALPSPTFGAPGLFWASLTLALLTLPVVIVSTEEGLARLPRSLREASFALGATRLQTVFWVVLPAASPALITGIILAVARAAGEVAPLMLVGVVKLAPSLPVDGNFPFLHLERQFMHLGFHIYDVGFQSPNVEAARPLVYATALLLVAVIVILNLAAIRIRNRLRERYKATDI